jgi:hypothetical protein
MKSLHVLVLDLQESLAGYGKGNGNLFINQPMASEREAPVLIYGTYETSDIEYTSSNMIDNLLICEVNLRLVIFCKSIYVISSINSSP